MNGSHIVVTEELIRRVNKNLIEGKRYPQDCVDAAARLPRLTPEQINGAWAKVMRDARAN